MLTLITGTPGSGKTLYAVWEIARHIPGSKVEADRYEIDRKLFSNIRDLIVDHTFINADNLNEWQTWAKPGEYIIYDEVQEVWRPRGLGSKVPECIQALETHRHMGVDIALVTQHPMLVDPNIRRLVNRHLHIRRVAAILSIIYEWDHCANPGQTKTCISTKFWWFPKRAYGLYKSAQVHTKTTAKFPKIAWLGVAALAAVAYLSPNVYAIIKNGGSQAAKSKEVSHVAQQQPSPAPGYQGASSMSVPAAPRSAASESVSDSGPDGVSVESDPVSGCVASGAVCKCYTASGKSVEPDLGACKDLHEIRKVLPMGHFPDSEVTEAQIALAREGSRSHL